MRVLLDKFRHKRGESVGIAFSAKKLDVGGSPMLMSEVTECSIKLLDWGAVGEPAVEDGNSRALLC